MTDPIRGSSAHQVWLASVSLFLFTTGMVNLHGGDWDGVQMVLGSVFPREAAYG